MPLRLLFVCAALVGSVYSAVWTRADYLFRKNTRQSVEAAVRLVPYNPVYLVWLAYLEPEHTPELLKRAVELNPFDAQSLIQLGLWAELQLKDPQLAFDYYQKAAEVDKTYLPKWTLTNYFFRQGNEAEFLRWAEASLAITPNSPVPVFDQMWSITDDGRRIEASIPNRVDILLPYVSYLNQGEHWSAIPAAVNRIVAVDRNNPVGRDDIIGPVEDNLLAHGEFTEALAVWSRLIDARWIGFNMPAPSNPLTNGDFAKKPFGHGFDWISNLPNKTRPGAHELQLKFEGCPSASDSCLLLVQYLPLAQGHTYRLQWSAQAQDLEAPSGIAWKTDWQRGQERSPDLLSQAGRTWDFQVPADRDHGRLELWYTRSPGTVVHPGTFTLRNVSLQER